MINVYKKLKYKISYILFIVFLSIGLGNDIILTSIPMDFYKSSESFTITWVDAIYSPVAGTLYLANSPGGGVLDNYTLTTASGTGSLTSTPSAIGYSPGSYYAVIGDASGNLSLEFQLIVESENSVGMIEPILGAEIQTTTPVFKWNVTSGVQYYHVILSDSPFLLDEDEEGNMTVEGAQAIWQVITSETSAQYGDIDLSGSFENNPPPLIDGIEYNWLVMNNYGNSFLYSSQVVSSPESFTYKSEVQLDSPQQIYPAFSSKTTPVAIEGEEIISFQWSEVNGAMTYQIFLSELKLEAGSEIQYPVWNQVTTNTLIDFNASSILIDAKYAWKIIASNADGVSSMSDVSYFDYSISFGQIELTTKVPCGNTYCDVGYASVEFDPIEGSGDAVPVAVDAGGYAVKNLPMGSYIITANKSGFETAVDTINFNLQDNINHSNVSNSVINDIGYSSYINISINMEWSPASIYGQVVDGSGVSVEIAEVVAISSEGVERSANVSGGSYSISVTPDTWTISAHKLGYDSGNSLLYSVSGGQSKQAENLILNKNARNIYGTVKNTAGTLLSGVLVTATLDNNIRQETTNGSGVYTFSGVENGNWSIEAEKLGYYAPSATNIEVADLASENENVNIAMDDITLSPQANIVSGNVNNTVVGIDDVTITATPSSGVPVTTTTNAYGNYSINLPGGNYQFSANKSNYSLENTHSLILTIAETVDGIDFVLIPNESFIQGTILSNEVGLSGVSVSTSESSDISDDNGDYKLSVSPGTYEISVQKTGYSSSGIEIVSIGAGQTISDIDFSMNANASTITGVVYASGATVFGADVKVEKIISNDLTIEIQGTNTSSSGSYQLDLLPGSYKLWAYKINFLTDTLSLNIQAGQSISNQNITLTANEAYISGNVTKENSEALRDADVIITEDENPENKISTISNIQGEYSAIVTPLKAYNVTITKDGYSSDTQSTSGTMVVGASKSFSSTLQALPASLSGLVKDDAGSLLPTATVTISNASATYVTETSIYGNYTVNISDGDYSVNSEKIGYISAGTSITVLPGQELTENFVLDRNFSSYSGIITNSSNNSVLEDVSVVATRTSGGGGTTKTDENGTFTLSDLLPGSYTLQFVLDGYASISLENEYLPGGISLDKSLTLTPYTATITVNSSYNSSALSGVTVSIENQASGEILSKTSDSNGACVFSGLSSNNITYLVTASKLNHIVDPQSTTLTTSDNEKTIAFSLVKMEKNISGKVVDADNTSSGVGGAVVSVVSSEGFSGQATTASTGLYQINNLNPGVTYTFSIIKDGYTSLSVIPSVLLEDDYPAPDIAITPDNRKITGVVKSQNGGLLSGVNVILDAVGFNLTETTDNSGVFEFTDLAPATNYFISTQALEEGYHNTETTVVMNAEQTLSTGDLVIQIDGSKINGTITSDAENSEVLIGVQLTAVNQANNSVYSATSQLPNGTYTLDKLSAGVYHITAIQESYASLATSVTVSDLETITKNIAMTFNAPLTVSGSVMGIDPLLDIIITLVVGGQILKDTTNALGEYQFTNVSPNQTVSISTGLSSVDFDNAAIYVLLTTTNSSGNDITIDEHSASYSITISDGSQVLEGASVTLKKDLEQAGIGLTDSNGNITFSNLYEGDYSVEISKSGYDPGTITATTIVDKQNKTGETTLSAKVGSIGGSVIISTTSGNISLSNVAAKLINPSTNETITTVATNTSGTFEFLQLVHDTQYKLNISKTGFESYETTFTYNSSSVQSFPVTLSISSNSIVGSVTNNNEAVGDTIQVSARSLEGIITSTVTDNNGDYVINGVTGYHDIWATNNNNSMVSPYVPVPLSEGVSDYVALALGQASKITGSIKYGSSGISGVSISAEDVNTGSLVSAYTLEGGSFTIPGMQTGNYNIIVYKEGYSVIGSLPTVSVSELGALYTVDDILLTFTNNSLSGTVVDDVTGAGIGEAEVSLYSNEVEIKTTTSDGGGGFIFSGLEDGDYLLSASHPGYVVLTNQVPVTLSSGTSDPVSIALVAKAFTIFGTIKDQNSLPLEDVIVTLSPEGSPVVETTSDNLGSYTFDGLSEGTYSLSITKQNYESDSDVISLTNTTSVVERNFYLTADPSLVSGIFSIDNQSSGQGYTVTVNSGTVTLTDITANQIIKAETINDNDKAYEFNELSASLYELALDITLDISREGSAQESINYLEQKLFTLAIAESKTGDGVNFIFTYNANSVNLSGSVKINHSGTLNNVEIGTVVARTSIKSDTTNIIGGQYYLYNMDLGTYDIIFTAEYDDEQFLNIITNHDLSSSGNYTLNDTLNYILSKLTFNITEDGTTPVESVSVKIVSDRSQISLLTDDLGSCETLKELHTNTEYKISISKDSGSLGKFIPMNSFTVTLSDLNDLTIAKQLPLQFNLSQLTSIPATNPIVLNLNIAASHTEEVILSYTNVSGEVSQYPLINGSVEVPAEGQSGDVSFYFTSGNYSNASSPFNLAVTSEGLLSASASTMLPANPIFAYGFQSQLSLNLFDDIGGAPEGPLSIIWSLSSENLGTIIQDTSDSTKASFTAATGNGDDITGDVIATISQLNENITIQLSNEITIKNLKLANLQITGPSELDNDESGFFPVSISDSSGISMTATVIFDSIYQWQGLLETVEGGIEFTPDSNFVGIVNITARAEDQFSGNKVSGYINVKVFELITPEDEASSLNPGNGFTLSLPQGMLKSGVGSARIELEAIERAPSLQASSSTSNIASAIITINSNKDTSDFNFLPGLSFELDTDKTLNNAKIKWWDNNEIKWVDIEENQNGRSTLSRSYSVSQIPGWYDYAIFADSDPLGIYNLDIRPNPFTPNNPIGTRISFTASSNVGKNISYSVSVYNLNGTKIKSIVRNLSVPKEYCNSTAEVSSCSQDECCVSWDGTTDQGDHARNGRYIIRVQIQDSSGNKELVKPVILVK